MRSIACASSVTATPERAASCSAWRKRANANTCGVSARHRPARSTVSSTVRELALYRVDNRSRQHARRRVSPAAPRGFVSSASASAPMSLPLKQGRAASCTKTQSSACSRGGQKLQAVHHRVLPMRAADRGLKLGRVEAVARLRSSAHRRRPAPPRCRVCEARPAARAATTRARCCPSSSGVLFWNAMGAAEAKRSPRPAAGTMAQRRRAAPTLIARGR